MVIKSTVISYINFTNLRILVVKLKKHGHGRKKKGLIIMYH